MKKKEISLRNWLWRYLIAMSLLLAVLYAFTQSFLATMLTERAEESIRKSIFIAEEGIENSLEIVDSFVYESLYSGSAQSASQLYLLLRYETDPITLAMARNTVVSSLKSIVTWSDMIDFMMIYTDREDEPGWMEAGNMNNYPARREVEGIIQQRIEAGELSHLERYMVCGGEERNYMIRLLKIEGSYFVVCVSEDAILRTLQNAEYDQNSIAFAAEADGRVIFRSGGNAGYLSPEQEGTYVEIDGTEYLQTGYVSDKTGYYFGMLTQKESILSEIWLYQMLFLGMFLIFLILMPVIFLFMHFSVEKPIAGIAATMDQIAEGEQDVTVQEKYRVLELSRLAHAFNHMIGRIRKLKIEKYEVQLEAQRATMQYLQLQIKPHFYANVLNVIYSLAQRKDFETIQRMSQAIVNYSRYMFHDANELVELQREIQHVRYYMEIQEIRYMMQIECQVEAAPETLNALIPTFIIQIFVENSVKYAFSTQKCCRIAIHAETDREREYLTIRISDNGEGYSDEILRQDWMHKKDDGHIGLSNVSRRLKLIYEDKARIQLYNDHGAVTMIRIPYISL